MKKISILIIFAGMMSFVASGQNTNDSTYKYFIGTFIDAQCGGFPPCTITFKNESGQNEKLSWGTLDFEKLGFTKKTITNLLPNGYTYENNSSKLNTTIIFLS